MWKISAPSIPLVTKWSFKSRKWAFEPQKCGTKYADFCNFGPEKKWPLAAAPYRVRGLQNPPRKVWLQCPPKATHMQTRPLLTDPVGDTTLSLCMFGMGIGLFLPTGGGGYPEGFPGYPGPWTPPGVPWTPPPGYPKKAKKNFGGSPPKCVQKGGGRCFWPKPSKSPRGGRVGGGGGQAHLKKRPVQQNHFLIFITKLLKRLKSEPPFLKGRMRTPVTMAQEPSCTGKCYGQPRGLWGISSEVVVMAF